MLNVEQVVTQRFPGFFDDKPALFTRPFLTLLRMLFYEKEINRFLDEQRSVRGIDFVEKVLEYFDFDYRVPSSEIENIPSQGRVIIVANHPLGALDALSLIQMVFRVRKDVKVLANDLLMSLQPLSDMLLPVDNMGGRSPKESIKKIHAALEQEQAVIVFPAGEVSRLRPNGVKDVRWKKGFLKFARRTGSPLLPVHIDARNSRLFYTVSMFSKPAAALLLVKEMFHQRANTISFTVGELIPFRHIEQSKLRPGDQVKLVRKHLYRIARNKHGTLATEKSIAHPESRQELKQELESGQLLGNTSDGKQIILLDWQPDSSVIREIGRLREYSFRKVGEGSGKRRDLDQYDQHYKHLVLWDDRSLEMVGAYRFGDTRSILQAAGVKGLYTASLFEFDPRFEPVFEHGLELGRSFVQPQYWGSRALDYLWQGLGAYLRHHREIRYLFGPVSISERYPRAATDLLVNFYLLYFGDERGLVTSKNPYRIGDSEYREAAKLFTGKNFRDDLQELKLQLSQFGLTIPTLYKQYTDLCEAGGVRFLDFGVDPAFSGCTDGFILVELDRVKAQKRKRYIGE